MAECFETREELGKEGLLHESVHIEKILTEEILCILERNQNEKYLRNLLTRALILEKIMK